MSTVYLDAPIIGSIEIDVTKTSVGSYSVVFSKYPLENGEMLSDNAINAPKTFVMEGIISTTSLQLKSTDYISGVLNRLNVGVPPTLAVAAAGLAGGTDNRIPSFIESMNNALSDKTLFDIDTGVDVMTNMGLEEFRHKKSEKSDSSIIISMSFTEIKTSTSSADAIVMRPDDVSVPANSGIVSRGRQMLTEIKGAF